MKRILLTALLLTQAFLTLKAQVGDPRSELAFGGSAGLNMSSVSFNPTIKQGSLSGPTFGATLRYTCEKYFTCVCAIQLECNFSQLGWKEEIELEDGSTFSPYSRKLNYVQIPFLARLGWGRERRGFQGFITLGPQMGLLLSDEAEQQEEEWESMHTKQYEAIDRNFDYGIVAGAGLEHSSKIGHFILEARYYYGLADFFDNSKKGYFGRSANSAITVRLSYLFDIVRSKNPRIK